MFFLPFLVIIFGQMKNNGYLIDWELILCNKKACDSQAFFMKQI